MALRKLERRKYDGKLPVSIKYQNLHSFKESLILLCQSILERRRTTHLHGSAHFTTPLKSLLHSFIHTHFHDVSIILNYKLKKHILDRSWYLPIMKKGAVFNNSKFKIWWWKWECQCRSAWQFCFHYRKKGH